LFVSHDEEVLRVAIKRIASGLFFDWAMNGLKPGDIIDSMVSRGYLRGPSIPASGATTSPSRLDRSRRGQHPR
jgi:ferredoxin-NADP reductase